MRKLASWGMVPRTRVARFTLYLAGIDALLMLIEKFSIPFMIGCAVSTIV